MGVKELGGKIDGMTNAVRRVIKIMMSWVLVGKFSRSL